LQAVVHQYVVVGGESYYNVSLTEF